MTDASKRKHSDSSNSELDTSLNSLTPDKNTKIKQKKKKGKQNTNQDTISETIETEIIDEMADIKQALVDMNTKLENLFSGKDSRFKQMIVDIINQTKNEFLKSIENKIDILEGKLFEKEKENDKLKEKVTILEKQIEHNHEYDKQNAINLQEYSDHHSGQLNAIEQYSRRNNVRIFGIPEDSKPTENGQNSNESSETTTQKVVAQLNEKIQGLNLQVGDIDIAHRLGKVTDGFTRPIIVKFVARQKRNHVMTNRKQFKGTDIFINEDLTNINQKVLMTIKKTLSEKEAAWSWDGKIFHKSTDSVVRPIAYEQYKYWIGADWPKLINRTFSIK